MAQTKDVGRPADLLAINEDGYMVLNSDALKAQQEKNPERPVVQVGAYVKMGSELEF